MMQLCYIRWVLLLCLGEINECSLSLQNHVALLQLLAVLFTSFLPLISHHHRILLSSPLSIILDQQESLSPSKKTLSHQNYHWMLFMKLQNHVCQYVFIGMPLQNECFILISISSRKSLNKLRILSGSWHQVNILYATINVHIVKSIKIITFKFMIHWEPCIQNQKA